MDYVKKPWVDVSVLLDCAGPVHVSPGQGIGLNKS